MFYKTILIAFSALISAINIYAQPTLVPYTPDPTNDYTPTLQWNAVQGATDYQIEVDDENTFASPLVTTKVTGATTYTPWSNLSAGRIYWHVSSSIDYNAFSDIDDFLISTDVSINLNSFKRDVNSVLSFCGMRVVLPKDVYALDIRLIDMRGKLVWFKRYNSFSGYLNIIPNISRGAYIVQIQMNNDKNIIINRIDKKITIF
jgi:hypothetical protein